MLADIQDILCALQPVLYVLLGVRFGYSSASYSTSGFKISSRKGLHHSVTVVLLGLYFIIALKPLK